MNMQKPVTAMRMNRPMVSVVAMGGVSYKIPCFGLFLFAFYKKKAAVARLRK